MCMCVFVQHLHTFLYSSTSRRCCSEHRPPDWLNKDDISALTRKLRNARGHSSRDRGARNLLHRGTRYPGRSAGCLDAGKKYSPRAPIKSRTTCALLLCMRVRLRVMQARLRDYVCVHANAIVTRTKISSKADRRLHAAPHLASRSRLSGLSRRYSRLFRDTVSNAGDSLLDLNISINNRLYGDR